MEHTTSPLPTSQVTSHALHLGSNGIQGGILCFISCKLTPGPSLIASCLQCPRNTRHKLEGHPPLQVLFSSYEQRGFVRVGLESVGLQVEECCIERGDVCAHWL